MYGDSTTEQLRIKREKQFIIGRSELACLKPGLEFSLICICCYYFHDMWLILLILVELLTITFQTFFHNSLLISCQPISFVLSFRFSLSRVNYKILSNIDNIHINENSSPGFRQA
jgi:hypothetical protein